MYSLMCVCVYLNTYARNISDHGRACVCISCSYVCRRVHTVSSELLGVLAKVETLELAIK